MQAKEVHAPYLVWTRKPEGWVFFGRVAAADPQGAKEAASEIARRLNLLAVPESGMLVSLDGSVFIDQSGTARLMTKKDREIIGTGYLNSNARVPILAESEISAQKMRQMMHSGPPPMLIPNPPEYDHRRHELLQVTCTVISTWSMWQWHNPTEAVASAVKILDAIDKEMERSKNSSDPKPPA